MSVDGLSHSHVFSFTVCLLCLPALNGFKYQLCKLEFCIWKEKIVRWITALASIHMHLHWLGTIQSPYACFAIPASLDASHRRDQSQTFRL